MKAMRFAPILGLTVGLTAAPAWAAELKFTTQDFPPFSYAVEGVVSGPAADIIRKVCAEMQAQCEFRLLPWSRAQQEVRDGLANGMFVIGWNEKRAEWVHFTPPILNTEYGFFVRADNALEYRTLADVAAYKVGVYGPSNTSASLERLRDQMVGKGIKEISIDMRPDDESGFRKLGLGRLDAVFSNRDVGYAMIAKLGLKDKVRYAGAQSKLKYYIGFSIENNDKATLALFDAAYRKLHQAGVVKAILEKYSMEPADLE